MTSMIEPPVAASARRIATVHIAVPEATMAWSITCMLGAPPVPRMSRDPNSVPAIMNGSGMSTSLDGGKDLHGGPVGEHERVPAAARHDHAIDRRRLTAARRVFPHHHVGQRRVSGERLRSSVGCQVHVVTIRG